MRELLNTTVVNNISYISWVEIENDKAIIKFFNEKDNLECGKIEFAYHEPTSTLGIAYVNCSCGKLIKGTCFKNLVLLMIMYVLDETIRNPLFKHVTLDTVIELFVAPDATDSDVALHKLQKNYSKIGFSIDEHDKLLMNSTIHNVLNTIEKTMEGGKTAKRKSKMNRKRKTNKQRT